MSMFDTATATCPKCGTEAELEVVLSVNADRRPDLRAEILDGSFQAVPCAKCGTRVRLEPEFVYFDLGRRQWIVVHPADAVDGWAEAEQHARAIFEESFGTGAPAQVRELTEGVAPRVVFGWPALQEKLLCADLALDDTALELLKLAILVYRGRRTRRSAARMSCALPAATRPHSASISCTAPARRPRSGSTCHARPTTTSPTIRRRGRRCGLRSGADCSWTCSACSAAPGTRPRPRRHSAGGLIRIKERSRTAGQSVRS